MAFKIVRTSQKGNKFSSTYLAHIEQNTKRFLKGMLENEFPAPYPINKEIAKAIATVYNWLVNAKVYRIQE